MPLSDTAALARQAAANKQGLGAFNVVLLHHAEMFVRAAENVGLPVILQLSQMRLTLGLTFMNNFPC